MKHVVFCLAGLLAAALMPVAAQADGSTVRIVNSEPYGAMVTREAGVLVFRGLPPTRKVIVNPDGKTPISFNQSDVVENKTVIVTQEDYANNLGARIIRIR